MLCIWQDIHLDVGRRCGEADGDLLCLIKVGEKLPVLLLLCHAVPVVALLLARRRLLSPIVLDLKQRSGFSVAHEFAEQLGLLKQIVKTANAGIFRLIGGLRGGRSWSMDRI